MVAPGVRNEEIPVGVLGCCQGLPRRLRWGGVSRIQNIQKSEALPPRFLFMPSSAGGAAG